MRFENNIETWVSSGLIVVGILTVGPNITYREATPGICSDTKGRMDDTAFVMAAIEEHAVGVRRVSGVSIDGTITVPLWPNAAAYLADFPDCCEIYDGPAGDWFTPPEKHPALWGQEGRVVRMSTPQIDFSKETPKIEFARRFVVLDDCARVVADD